MVINFITDLLCQFNFILVSWIGNLGEIYLIFTQSVADASQLRMERNSWVRARRNDLKHLDSCRMERRELNLHSIERGKLEELRIGKENEAA